MLCLKSFFGFSSMKMGFLREEPLWELLFVEFSRIELVLFFCWGVRKPNRSDDCIDKLNIKWDKFNWLVSLVKFEFQGKVEVFLWLGKCWLLHFFQLLFFLFLGLDFLFFILYLLSLSFKLFLNFLTPILINLLVNPRLDFYTGNTLHPEYFQPRMVSPLISIRHSLNSVSMLTSGMLDHGVNGGEFFRAFGATKVFGFLMMMQNDFIFKWLITIEAKGSEAGHIPSFSPHAFSLLNIIRVWYIKWLKENWKRRFKIEWFCFGVGEWKWSNINIVISCKQDRSDERKATF